MTAKSGLSIDAIDGVHYVVLPKSVINRWLFWNAEVARYPSDAVAITGNTIASHVVKLERRADAIFVRSMSSGAVKVAGQTPATSDEAKLRPVDIAIANAQIGPIIASLPIVAEQDDAFLLDVSAIFASDIPDFSVKSQLLSSGLIPIAVDPSRSYIATAAAFPDNLYVASQLTFIAQDQAGADRALSVEVAHSISLLPEQPMERRYFDDRIGYFTSEVITFEAADGAASETQQIALRHRLEHADPDAPKPSAPVEPLVYYLAPEIPERWRPYIRAAVEDWQPAFEAAGFSGAIVARDAPSQEEDPDWSPNDARYNVIRWVAQPFANAMGPNIHDPRSGEILSAHILVWPEVLTLFGNYYYNLMSQLDPDAATLPLPEETLGHILRYAVSHEVGHTLGLRHNHKASTAWGIEQLRDPEFTAERGSTASIMAYGRFNYVARPGDGVTQLFPLIGTYDDHAITWGYADLTPDALEALASEVHEEPELAWGAGELPSEGLQTYDPTVLKENIGADRIEATRAGIAAIGASILNLPQATMDAPDPAGLTASVYDQAKDTYLGFTGSVAVMVGGVLSSTSDGEPLQYVAVSDQKAALTFLASEAIDGLAPFADPALLMTFRPFGGVIGTDYMAERIIGSMLEPDVIRRVYAQNELDPNRNFGVAEMLATITDAFIAEGVSIADMPPAQRAAIAEYVRLLQLLPTNEGNPDMAFLGTLGVPRGLVDINVAGLGDTGIAAAASVELERLAAAFEPHSDGFATRLFKDVERALGVDVGDD
ncbi:zinc-dependent metalloprotease [Yoonia sp. 208BN28-4]|uniref:zinc-dependent metalloprotease n=1 Tax=Yoonia sp. 208BN28-4 TaxID=3126505 RepID=UPI00309D5886